MGLWSYLLDRDFGMQMVGRGGGQKEHHSTMPCDTQTLSVRSWP